MSTAVGKAAEAAAAHYLQLQGLNVIELNWRNRFCEIDIVASSIVRSGVRKQKIIHFVEVKYRHTTAQGDGLEYITSKKLEQMTRAASFWVHEHDWTGDYQLDAIAVSGNEHDWQFDYRPNVTAN